MNRVKKELEDYKILLRNIPSPVVTLFTVSVIAMNLLANKELISMKYLALDCGFVLSWISFLCMDMICKRFGPKASVKISILALVCNLGVTLVFKLMSMTPGMWGEYYTTGLTEVNDGLNATFGGSWYVVLGSSLAMLVSSFVNSALNSAIGKRLANKTFGDFALRSFVSTGIGQFVDNLVFAVVVSYNFFGWSAVQVLTCSLTGAVAELLCEVLLSPVGYRATQQWAAENVGQQYLDYAAAQAAGKN